MTDEGPFLLDRSANGVCTIRLNRPDIHNAFDDQLIVGLTDCLQEIGSDDNMRALVLTGRGKSFSAGADLNWMRRSADYGEAENLADARALARLMSVLNELPKPTIAKINGAALGGGVGLVCCCDIAIASEAARFGTTEVRLGIMPSVIGPYVVAAIGPRQARRLMLTGERIDAAQAKQIGLVHEVAAADRLDATVDTTVRHLLDGGPQAIRSAKALVHDLAATQITPKLIDETAKRIAALRATAEAKEGLGAFLDKRSPNWRM